MLISLCFLACSGFLALHALATPKVLLDGPNAGFVLATPVGLLVGSAFAALSTRDQQGPGAVRNARSLRMGLLVAMAVWGALSLAEVPPLDDPTPAESGSSELVVLAVPGLGLYAWATWRYLVLFNRRRSPLPLSVAAGFLLLAEAMVAVTFSRNWHLTWWEWHLLLFSAFAVVVVTARRQWREERFSDLYLEDTVAGKREVSVLFADLSGFTAFSEQRDPREVSEMLNAYFEAAIPPVVEGEGGEIDRVMGDAIMASFNRRGDQHDHPVRAARAALALRDATEAVARGHPGWPRFRIGVNTGEAMTGVVGTHGGRSYTVIGDAVNVAARLESAAPVGGVAVSAETLGRLEDADAEPLGDLRVKGRERPIEAFSLRRVNAT
jgi:class 3 adenylate cyclase